MGVSCFAGHGVCGTETARPRSRAEAKADLTDWRANPFPRLHAFHWTISDSTGPFRPMTQPCKEARKGQRVEIAQPRVVVRTLLGVMEE